MPTTAYLLLGALLFAMGAAGVVAGVLLVAKRDDAQAFRLQPGTGQKGWNERQPSS